MASNAKSNFGTKFQLEKILNSGTYIDIAECRIINSPTEEQDDIEVTHHGSVGWREFKPSGLRNPGDLELQINSVPSDESQQELEALAASGEDRNWKIIRPNGITETFSAYVKSIVANEADAQNPDAIIDTVALKLTGPCTRGYDASL